MLELKHDEKTCAACETVDCFTKCRYQKLPDKDAAKAEMIKLINGEDTPVLRNATLAKNAVQTATIPSC